MLWVVTALGCNQSAPRSTGKALRENSMLKALRQIWNDDRGQDIAEYAMMLAVILLIVTATVSSIGTNANTVFGNAANKLTTA
jgi:Flp pilus assembly pilin Flp